jgi:hypothetical protein
MPLLAIISYEMRSAYLKLSAVSTKVRTSKSGGMGSNDALGRAAGIVMEPGGVAVAVACKCGRLRRETLDATSVSTLGKGRDDDAPGADMFESLRRAEVPAWGVGQFVARNRRRRSLNVGNCGGWSWSRGINHGHVIAHV